MPYDWGGLIKFMVVHLFYIKETSIRLYYNIVCTLNLSWEGCACAKELDKFGKPGMLLLIY